VPLYQPHTTTVTHPSHIVTFLIIAILAQYYNERLLITIVNRSEPLLPSPTRAYHTVLIIPSIINQRVIIGNQSFLHGNMCFLLGKKAALFLVY